MKTDGMVFIPSLMLGGKLLLACHAATKVEHYWPRNLFVQLYCSDNIITISNENPDMIPRYGPAL